MAIFDYQASDPTGKLRSGNVTAESMEEALTRIFDLNLTPVNIRPLERENSGPNWKEIFSGFFSVPSRDLILFTKQLATMSRVGIPISQVFGILQNQTEHAQLRRMAETIRNDVDGGSSLSGAMEKHRNAFSPLYCSIVEAGETSGTLPEVLDRLLYLLEHEAMIKAEIRTALRYPLMVVATLAVAFVIMLGFVIPRFVQFFLEANLTLPLPTRICISLSEFLLQYGLWLAVGSILAAWALHRYTKTGPGRYQRDLFLLHLPLVGPVLQKAAMSRFASIFAILQASGVLVLDALRILSVTVGNAAIAAEFDKIRNLLEEGRGIAEPLRSAKYFPPMLINMVAIGEESGRLDEMLREASSHYDTEVHHSMKKMSDSIGPILIISLTVVVGFFALAIYMPMWDLTQMATQRT